MSNLSTALLPILTPELLKVSDEPRAYLESMITEATMPKPDDVSKRQLDNLARMLALPARDGTNKTALELVATDKTLHEDLGKLLQGIYIHAPKSIQHFADAFHKLINSPLDFLRGLSSQVADQVVSRLSATLMESLPKIPADDFD